MSILNPGAERNPDLPRAEQTAMTPALSYGPWAPGIERVECRLQMRGMSVIAYMLLGPYHPLWSMLRAGETDPTAYVEAQSMVERLPSLTRRRLLATHMAITWPRPKRTPR